MITLSNNFHVTLSVGELRKAIAHVPDNEPVILELDLNLTDEADYIYMVEKTEHRQQDDGISFKGFYIHGNNGTVW